MGKLRRRRPPSPLLVFVEGLVRVFPSAVVVPVGTAGWGACCGVASACNICSPSPPSLPSPTSPSLLGSSLSTATRSVSRGGSLRLHDGSTRSNLV